MEELLFNLEFDNNILIGSINREVVDLEYAQKIVAARQKLTKGEDFRLLVKLHRVKKITKEARDYFASKEACKGILVGALYVDSV